MIRKLLTVLIFLGSLAGLFSAAGIISATLSAYPPDFYRSFGPIVPVICESYAALAPLLPTLLPCVAVLSIGLGVYFWRSSKSTETKTFAVTLMSALNYFFAMFSLGIVLVAYFMLPKLANGA